MSSNQQEYVCYECARKYPDFNKYQAHIKLKHKQGKTIKANLGGQEIGEVEDKIYSFLGDLAEDNLQGMRESEFNNHQEEQRFSGQANFSPSLIVRTPYQPEINIIDEIPTNYKFTPNFAIKISTHTIITIIQQINSQIKLICTKLEEERLYWQFADPTDLRINFQNQFSILDISKFICNYEKKGLILKKPQVTIFLIWIGRVCKVNMFKLVYEVIVSYWLCFENYCIQETLPQTPFNFKLWSSFIGDNKFEGKEKKIGQLKITKFCLQLNFNRIENEKLQNLIILYEKWVSSVLSFFEQQKQKLKNEV